MTHLLTAVLGLAATAAPAPHPAQIRAEFTQTIMAVPVMIVLYGPSAEHATEAAAAAFRRGHALDAILSDYQSQSEIRRLTVDAAGPDGVEVSPDLWRVLVRAQEISEASGGAFDITAGALTRLWRWARRRNRLPPDDLLQAARAVIDWRAVALDPARRRVRLLKEGMRLDAGGIAKGYVLDEMLAVLRSRGITAALIDAGGDMVLGDPPPGRDGWRIALPTQDGDAPPPALWLSRCAVCTSGDTYQHIAVDGRRYSHVIDPRTGMSLVDHGMVTVVAPDGMTADALASAVSVLGPAGGLTLIEKTPGTAARIVRGLPTDGVTEVHASTGWARIKNAPPDGGTPGDAPKPIPAACPGSPRK